MSFPRYAKYKDSGVEWLGAVPEHWEVKRLKQACHVFPSNVDKKCLDGETPVVLCNYTDVYYNERITSAIEFMAATASPDQIAKFTLRSGDTIITKDSETADDIAVAAYVPKDMPGVVCGYHLSMVRPMPHIYGAFIKRLFDSVYAKSCFATLANGLTRVGLGQYELDNIVLPFPPISEQFLIAEFLDRETAKIDALVGEQQRLIEVLKEKRHAVISHAVTKGLNPNSPMKPSGVEWLGNIPNDWIVQPLKRLVSNSRRITYGIVQPGEPDPSGRYMIRGKDYSVGWCRPDAIFRVSSEIETPYARARMQEHDLVMTIVGAGVGNVAVIPDWLDGANITQTSARIAIDPARVDPAFACYALQGVVGQRNLERYVYGSAQPRLNLEHVEAYLMTVPPIEAQRQIVDFLNGELGQLEGVVAHVALSSDLLQERRTALISAAVTGKIDVRDLVESEAA